MNLNKVSQALLKKIPGRSFSRNTIAVCTLSLAGGSLYAQAGFDFGLKGIFQTSSLINSKDQAAGPELDYKNNTSIAGGISAGYNFNRHVGLEINILSSKQGQGYTGLVGDINQSSGNILSSEFATLAASNNIPFSGTYTARIDLKTLKIPILFRYTGNNTRKIFFSSFIGPQLNMLSAATIQINGQTASTSKSYGLSATDLYKKSTMDIAFGFGAGVNLTDNFVLSVHLRLDYGMGDVENKSATATANVVTYKVYGADRTATNNATGGGLISLNYKLAKKAKAPVAPARPMVPKKPGAAK